MTYENKAMQAARILNAEDVAHCNRDYLADPASQVARRNLIRAEFAFIEAGLHGIRYIAAIGDVSQIPEKTPAKDNMEQSFNELAKTLGIPIAITKQNAGWDSMTKALKIRDRITHPKKPEDLDITDTDLKIFNRATQWFSDVMVALRSVVDLVPEAEQASSILRLHTDAPFGSTEAGQGGGNAAQDAADNS